MASIEEGEDDYMSMIIPEKSDRYETSLAKRARLKKEAKKRAQPKSKAERVVEEDEARECALAKRIDSTSKGYQMLYKLGYKSGTKLGPLGSDDISATQLNPLPIKVKEDRGGVGLDSERKRKFWEKHKENVDDARLGVDDFRAGIANRQAEMKCESLWQDAMAVMEQLEAADEVPKHSFDMARGSENSSVSCKPAYTHINQVSTHTRSLKNFNILYRSLLRRRTTAEQELRLRCGFLERTLRTSIDDTQGDDLASLEGKHDSEEKVDEEDEELNEFEALHPAVKLQKVVIYLRETYSYCFWCKCRYPGPEMEGCPGPAEEDHD